MGEAILNMSDPKQRQRVINRVRELRGVYRFDVRQYRPRRTDRQNRLYWPVYVQPFAEFLRDQGEDVSNEQAHEILKHKFLRREMVDETTGEPMVYTASTTDLDTSEFNEYLERCAHWLADMFGIVVEEPLTK